jgi:hypothetical protein
MEKTSIDIKIFPMIINSQNVVLTLSPPSMVNDGNQIVGSRY